MYIVFKLPVFEKRAKKVLSEEELNQVNVFIEKLKINALVGRPLSHSFLREKRIGSKRIYFLVYKEICLVLLVSASDKKSQQRTIDEIKEELQYYKEFAYKLHERINNSNT